MRAPDAWCDLMYVIVIVVDKWLAAAQYASGWPSTVLEVLELDGLRARSVPVVSTSTPDWVTVMDIRSTYSRSHGSFLEDLVLSRYL